ncbi:hypothetical protein D9M69_374490 [compost metagenome]
MIDVPPGSFRVTPYGEVDATALEQVRDSYDSALLLRLVDRLDACLAEMGGVVTLRDELLRLHAMALTLVEGAAPAVPTEGACIWVEAESVQLDLDALAIWIRSAQSSLTPLVNLVPDHEQ